MLFITGCSNSEKQHALYSLDNAFYVDFCLFNTMMGIVNGLGIVKYPTIVNLISLWGIRIPICYLLGNLFGKKYLLGGIAASYLFAFLCMLVFVFIHLKMERKRN